MTALVTASPPPPTFLCGCGGVLNMLPQRISLGGEWLFILEAHPSPFSRHFHLHCWILTPKSLPVREEWESLDVKCKKALKGNKKKIMAASTILHYNFHYVRGRHFTFVMLKQLVAPLTQRASWNSNEPLWVHCQARPVRTVAFPRVERLTLSAGVLFSSCAAGADANGPCGNQMRRVLIIHVVLSKIFHSYPFDVNRRSFNVNGSRLWFQKVAVINWREKLDLNWREKCLKKIFF